MEVDVKETLLVVKPGCIRTNTGVMFNFVDPKSEDVKLEDVAFGLSNMNRWGGQHRQNISVAQHSLRVAQILEDAGHPLEVVLQGLMHDSSEAYVVDVPRPLKVLLPQYKEIEDRVSQACSAALGFAYPYASPVHDVDNQVLQEEYSAWVDGVDMEQMPPQVAREAFKAKYHELESRMSDEPVVAQSH